MFDNTFGSLSTRKRRGAALCQMRLWALALLLVIGLVGSTNAAHAQSGNLNITNVQLTNFQIVNNVLRATGTVSGTLAGLPFTTQITNFALHLVADNPATAAVECSVLDLALAPIHVSLLGLHADTSAICLTITATPDGGLLGNLLCGLAGGGIGGLGVPILPTTSLLGNLQFLLTSLLNSVLGQNPTQGGNGQVCTGQCQILDLVLGPLSLSLLGVNVNLDNCANGPVEICVSATASEGLLGQLLCGLSNPLLRNLSLGDIAQLASRALALAADGVLSGRDIAELRGLLAFLVRA